VSTGFVKQTLEKFEFGNESAATAPPPCPVPCDGHVSPPLRDSSGHTRVQSSPFPTTPSKTSFAAALQVGNNESPTDVLRRLSAGIANGTIKAPNTPELKALRMPSINEVESHWRLTAPERTSSLTKLDQELQTKLKRLSDRFESAKRDSMISVDRDDKRTSLISELDPALIDYMSRYADRISSEEAHGHDLVEEAAVGRDDEIIEPLTSQDPSIHSQIKDETFSRPDIYSLAETDSDSVHLFNMRISQRLASQSRVPLQSPNTSNNASTWSVAVDSAANLEACGQGSVSNLTRYPTWIAPEHNRRPSDPQTKMLFERGTQQGKANAHTWKTITSVNSGSTSFDPKTKFTRMGKDDSSSFYQSDAELARSQVSSPIDRSRRSSFQNPHSLAVGGRSVSAGFPGAPRNDSLSPGAGPPAWFRRRSQDKARVSGDDRGLDSNGNLRGRSISMPQKRDKVQEKSPTPIPRRLRSETSAAENLSDISLERIFHRRNEGLTELSAQAIKDRRNEKMSEIDHHRLVLQETRSKISGEDGERDPARSSPGLDAAGRMARPTRGTVSDDASSVGVQECGTSVWERAFRNALDDPHDSPTGDFLAAPRFDREGRRRHSLRASANVDDSVFRHRTQSVSGSRRSQSVGAPRRSSASADLDAHQELCSKAREPLPRVGPGINFIAPELTRRLSQTTREKTKPRKKSVPELGRRFASVAGTPEYVGKSASPTPIRDLLSLWARFPSHTREERNASATDRDGVKVRDFLPETPLNEAWDYPAPTNKSSSNLRPFASSAMKRLQTKTSRQLDKSKSKSTTLRAELSTMMLSPAERARRSRKGLVGRWKRLYRSSSSELRKYANARGHRSSFSVGDTPEYPELEILPGEGLFRVANFQKRQATDDSANSKPEPSWAIGSTETTRAVAGSDDLGMRKPDAADLARSYANCVGSLSALKSEDGDVISLTLSNQFDRTQDRRIGDVVSTELRDSTSDFRRQLGVEQERAKEELMEKIERIGNNEDDEGERENVSQKEGNEVERRDGAPRGAAKGKEKMAEKRLSKEMQMPGRFTP
jgi:hypothetical protein